MIPLGRETFGAERLMLLNMNLLEVKNVSKHFPIKRGLFHKSTETVKAVRNVSFEVGIGESYGVVGESG